jgi:Tol biopolymer transport system component
MISFISNRDGNKALYVMNADGSGQRRMTTTSSDESAHEWHP